LSPKKPLRPSQALTVGDDTDLHSGTFHLLPPEPRINDLRKDYAAMSAMIFGEASAWENIIAELRALEKRINKP